MNRRTLTTMVLLGLAIAALPQPSFAQSNSNVGTWKLNLAKSKYSPGPSPKSNTLIIEAVGQGLKVTTEGVNAQGNPTKVDFGVILYDGKSYPVTGVPDYDANSSKRVNESTTEFIRTKAGKVVQTTTGVTSADGKTVSFTTTGVNAIGQQINNIAVYDKQ
jgi:hypothetical protein